MCLHHSAIRARAGFAPAPIAGERPRSQACGEARALFDRALRIEFGRDVGATDEVNARSVAAERRVQRAIRFLARADDHGVDREHARLVTGVAQLRDHEQALAAIEAAQDALEHEATALRDTGSDREASLRFALGELKEANAYPDGIEGMELAVYARDKQLSAMAKVREAADNLEKVVADDLWPLPKYEEMLFIK